MQSLDRRARVDAVGVVHRPGEFPPQAVVQRELGRPSPLILKVHAADALRFAPRARACDVVVRGLVDVVRPRDAADPARQQRVQRQRIRQIRRPNARNRRR